jgi:hypothetical protein
MTYEALSALKPNVSALKYRANGDFLVVSGNNLQIQYLNEVAKDFYLKINGVNSIDDICKLLLAEYDVEEQKLHKDIVMLVRDLQWSDLITLSA